MPTVVVIQHVAVEGLGRIAAVLAEAGIDVERIGPRSPLPQGSGRVADGVIVLGGPMSAYDGDRHPRLRDEMALLGEALASKTPILGICLGSQLLAATLGARVVPSGSLELGWHEVRLSPEAEHDALFRGIESPLMALHWHGDVFELPTGATHLARSYATAQQAFSYGGHAWGLLFHLEAAAADARNWVSAFPHDVLAAKTTAAAVLGETETHSLATERVAAVVFRRWADLVVAGAASASA
jgi:GMP synthase (glutamine-hydrolysing)